MTTKKKQRLKKEEKNSEKNSELFRFFIFQYKHLKMKALLVFVLSLSVQLCYSAIPACSSIKISIVPGVGSRYYGQCGDCVVSQYTVGSPIGSFYVNCSSNYTHVYRNASCTDLIYNFPFANIQIGPCDDCVYVEKIKYSEPYAIINNFTVLQNYSFSNCSKSDNSNDYYRKKNETLFSFHLANTCGDNNTFNNQYYGHVVCIPNALPTSATTATTFTLNVTTIVSTVTTSTQIVSSTIVDSSTVGSPSKATTMTVSNVESSDNNSTVIGIVIGCIGVSIFVCVVFFVFLLKRIAKSRAKEETVENTHTTIVEERSENPTYSNANEYANAPEETKKYCEYENVKL